MRRRRSRRSRRPAKALAATIAERTAWEPPPEPALPQPVRRRPPPVDPRARAVLSALAALPHLAAEIGVKVAAQPDGRVELLPGEPTTLVFHARGQMQGMFVLPADQGAVRRHLKLEPAVERDLVVERQWEEQRLDDHIACLPLS